MISHSNKVSSFLERKKFLLISFLLWTFLLIVLLLVIYSLNKGLNFCDEAWYLLQINPTNLSSRASHWMEYVKELYPIGLIELRIITLALLLLSGIIFSIGFGKFTNTKILYYILPASIFSIFLLWPPVTLVPNYFTINIFIFYTSIGIFLLSISTKNIVKSSILALLTGSLVSQLFFVMITNTPFIFLVLLPIIIILKDKREDKLRILFFIIIGIVIGICFFFVFIVPINLYIDQLKATVVSVQSDKTHGLIPMFFWIKNTIEYIFKEVVLPAILLMLIINKQTYKKPSLQFVSLVLFSYLSYIMLIDFKRSSVNITPITPFLIIISTIFFHSVFSKDKNNYIISFMFISVLFFGSLGTDVNFSIRASLYAMPAIVFLLYYGIEKNKYLLPFVLLALIISFVRFSNFINQDGWYGYKISKQTVKIDDNNSIFDLKIDHKRAERIMGLKEIIPTNSSILISSKELWGYVYLLNCQPHYVYYNYDEDLVKYYFFKVKKIPNEIYLLENANDKFPENMFIKETYNICDTIPLTGINDINLYRYRE